MGTSLMGVTTPPEVVLTTPRFSLSKFCAADAEGMYELNRQPEAIRYTGNAPFESISAAREFITRYDHYERRGFGRWSVREIESGRYVGWCGLSRATEEAEVDIGFRFFPDVWNRGFATECARASISYGRETLGLRRIIGRVHPDNHASKRVLHKLGLAHVGFEDDDAGRWEVYSIDLIGHGP